MAAVVVVEEGIAVHLAADVAGAETAGHEETEESQKSRENHAAFLIW